MHRCTLPFLNYPINKSSPKEKINHNLKAKIHLKVKADLIEWWELQVLTRDTSSVCHFYRGNYNELWEMKYKFWPVVVMLINATYCNYISLWLLHSCIITQLNESKQFKALNPKQITDVSLYSPTVLFTLTTKMTVTSFYDLMSMDLSPHKADKLLVINVDC